MGQGVLARLAREALADEGKRGLLDGGGPACFTWNMHVAEPPVGLLATPFQQSARGPMPALRY